MIDGTISSPTTLSLNSPTASSPGVFRVTVKVSSNADGTTLLGGSEDGSVVSWSVVGKSRDEEAYLSLDPLPATSKTWRPKTSLPYDLTKAAEGEQFRLLLEKKTTPPGHRIRRRRRHEHPRQTWRRGPQRRVCAGSQRYRVMKP